MEAPVLINPIPTQIINEHSAYGPFDLKAYIQVSEGNSVPEFHAELKNGNALPQGLICTADGVLTGIPAKETQGNYEVSLTARNEAGSIEATFLLVIKPAFIAKETDYIDKLKAQVWEALDQRLPIPDLTSLYERDITILDIYYLLERWGTLKIWDAFNLDPPGDKVLLNLEGVSEHYQVFDRGSCLVAAPKDLFSYERTLEDGLQTARAMAREVYQRNWTIELVGYEKYVRAAWVEIQFLGDKHGKQLDVINFAPSSTDIKIYQTQVIEKGLK